MKKFFKISFIILTALVTGIFILSCSGGDGSTSTQNTDNTITPGLAPELIWKVEDNVKNPVTDLARCAESVMACIATETTLQNCFTKQVTTCTGAAPTEDCCMQACSDQLTQELNNGSNEQDAFLEVFVYDGSCMPGITKGSTQ